MQKLFKRSLAMVLAIMMVLTMFAGAVAEETLTPFTSYSEMGSAVYHIANAGINFADDANAMHMQYLAQEFVPAESTISGVKLAMNYGDGQGEMHIEIREGGANGTAVYTENVAVTAKGDGAAWYTFNFSQNVTVTPNTLYAVAFWFQSKTTTGFAIIHGGAKSEQVLWRHKRFESDGSKTYEPAEVTLKTTESTIGFEILAPQAAVPGEVVFFDGTSMPHHAADRGKWQPETNNFTTGGYAYRALADFRSGDKLSHSRLYNDELVDITDLYNENGEFYLTFDFYADPDYVGKADHYNNDNELIETKDYGLESTRFLVLLYSKGENQTATDPKSGKQAIEVTRWERGNANANETNDWNMFGLENGLQPGWNRMALKLTDKDGVLSYGKEGQTQYWDPTKMWGISFLVRAANWQDPYDEHGTVETIFDNIKFMSVEAYEEKVAPIKANYQFRDCESLGYQNTPRGEFYSDSTTYTEGTSAIRADLDWRGDSKLHWAWMGKNDGSGANTDTMDISKAIDANGDFYVTFDFWADPDFVNSATNHDKNTGEVTGTFEGGLNQARFVLNIVTRGEGQVDNMDNAKEAIQIDKPSNGDWSIYGLEDGLQAGWNHMAIKLNANQLKSGNEQYWDPTKLWGVKFHLANLWYDEKEAHGTAKVRFDDIRFMSVAAYEADFARVNAAKDAIAAIAEMDKNDDASVEAAKKVYNDVPGNAKYLVSNAGVFDKLDLLVNESIYTVDGVDCGMGWIMVPAGPQDNTPYNTTPTPWTESYTEGTGSGKVQWANTDNPTMHLSIMGVDKTWDLTDAEYITFDLYVHGWSVKNTGDTDFNFGFGTAKDPGSWGNQDLGWIGKDALWNNGVSTLKEGWNHFVLPIASGAKKAGVGNMRLFFEKSVVFSDAVVAGTDKAYAIIDDIRAVNNKGLAIVQSQYNAKAVITDIQAIKAVEDVAAVRQAYDALSEAEQGYVFNLADLETWEAAIGAAAEFDAKVEAMGEVTYADKDAVAALVEEYNALTDEAKAFANADALQALVDTINNEQAALDDVNAKIDAIPALEELELADEAVVEIAREAYDALADDTKAAVTVSATDVLEAAEEKIQELIDLASDDVRAAAMEKAIAKLPYAEEITLADAELIKRVAQKYDALPEGAKALVGEEYFKKLYSVVVMLNALEADDAAAAEVDALIAGIPADLTLENKDAVYAARDAYAALNDNAKLSVEGKDALADAVAVMDKLVADADAAAELAAAINALTDASTKAEIQAVVDLYNAASAETIALLDAETFVKYNKVFQENNAYDVTLRTFDQQRLNDLNVEDIQNGVWAAGQKSDIAVLGSQYFWVQSQKDTNRLFLYVYAHKQNEFVDANGNNAEGSARLIVGDINDMYVTFDFYVSDAEVLKSTNDAGFGLDTKEGGGSSAWGNTMVVKSSVVKEMIAGLEDGWNHVVLPLSWKSASQGAKFTGTAMRVESFRFYINNIEVPTGFVAGMDDIHFVNGIALETMDAKRAIAVGITDDIRNYPAEATADDFYAIYAAYNGLEAEYQALVKGWDAFIEANAEKIAAANEALAADQAVAAPVAEKIAALDKDITVADEEAIVAAEAAYAELTDAQKALVGNSAILTFAREALDEAKEKQIDIDAAQVVIDAINALPETVSDTDVTNTDIAAAREAYDGLTDAQKAIVGDLLAKLEAAEANLVIAKDMAAAGEVEALINALATPTDINEEDADVVNAALDAYNKLTTAQKDYVSEAAKAKLTACVEALSNPAVTMGDVDGNGKIDAKDALEILKAAVGKVELTDAQQKAADVDKDGKIGAKDALEILKHVVDKPSALDK